MITSAPQAGAAGECPSAQDPGDWQAPPGLRRVKAALPRVPAQRGLGPREWAGSPQNDLFISPKGICSLFIEAN